MPTDDLEYYRLRAVDERALAESAADSRVAEIHRELADKYDALASEGE